MTVALSYIVMLCYVSVSIGHQRECVQQQGPRGLVEKAILAATALAMVLVSISVAAALCSMAGVPATMILSEVIPFLGELSTVSGSAVACGNVACGLTLPPSLPTSLPSCLSLILRQPLQCWR